MAFLTGNDSLPDGTAPVMNFEHELITVIANEGSTDAVMDAARSAGAAGGTVLHAKGTGAQRAQKFFGSLSSSPARPKRPPSCAP